jgi:hypothetical protein
MAVVGALMTAGSVSYDDVRAVAYPALRHRLILSL